MPRCARRIGLPLVFLVLAVMLPACAHLPRDPLTASAQPDELARHVRYLASPQLRGRQPRTAGSRKARQYIIDRFAAYGLEPWNPQEGFEQPFIIGANVVGVLRGSDPQLASQFVLVSAHYDHLGYRKGKMHLGAADNASGVAVMLEVAERLARSPQRPRRSVVFAAFDAEEAGLLGSFAFTARDDFNPDGLAGLVNLDMLGRDCLDVMDHTLLAFGTENYPQLRQDVLAAADAAQLRVLPLGRDLVGPRSDHAPFELYDKPWVFLTCGEYNDYHRATDTADRLDYEQMRRAVYLVAQTVRSLADADAVEQPTPPAAGDRQELQAIRQILRSALAQPKKANIDRQSVERLTQLAQRVDALLEAPSYSALDRLALAADVAQTALPILVGGSWGEKRVEAAMILRDIYLRAPSLLLEGRRDLMRHLLAYQPGLFRGTPPFTYDGFAVNDQTVQLHAMPDGRLRLSLMVPRVQAQVRIGWFGQHDHDIRFSIPIVGDCVGTREQLIDYCLLRWRNAPSGPPPRGAWPAVLRRLTGEDHGDTFDDWLHWRLAQTPYQDEMQWTLALLAGDNPDLIKEAIDLALWEYRQDVANVLPKLIQNDRLPATLRASAIKAIELRDGPDALRALTQLLPDPTRVLASQDHRAFDPGSPFYHDGITRAVRKRLTQKDRNAPTLGGLALEKLRGLTDQDFGSDAVAWQQWLTQHAGTLAEARSDASS